MQKGIEKALNQLNIEYDVLYHILKDWENDKEFEVMLCKKIDESKIRSHEYDMVFSVNYVPIISNVCEKIGLQYVSWVYDSPLHIRDKSSMVHACNTIYFFDYIQTQEFVNAGVSGARYMPLATDIEYWSKVTENKYDERYQCDVSLVGQLYKSDFEDLAKPLDEYYRGYLEGIINAQQNLYGGYILDQLLTDDLMKKLNTFYSKEDEECVKKAELEYALAKECTGRERFLALALLSSRYKTRLYAGQNDDRLTNIEYMGYADYYTEMPKIFYNSKINLNISLKTIKSGIPLRILDICGAGGFVLTNYQQEIMQYFTPGVDIVVYENPKDMVEKVKYYMEHEDERKQIAINGRNTVTEKFGFKEKLQLLLITKEQYE